MPDPKHSGLGLELYIVIYWPNIIGHDVLEQQGSGEMNHLFATSNYSFGNCNILKISIHYNISVDDKVTTIYVTYTVSGLSYADC